MEGREKRKVIQGRVEGRKEDKERRRKFIDIWNIRYNSFQVMYGIQNNE